MTGIDALTGRALAGDAHLAQSIGDILATPVGTRVQRRDYGSLLFDLIDAPFNALTRIRMFAAVALALRRWEPRIELTRVSVDPGSTPGQVTIGIEGRRTDVPTPGEFARLTIPLRLRAAS